MVHALFLPPDAMARADQLAKLHLHAKGFEERQAGDRRIDFGGSQSDRCSATADARRQCGTSLGELGKK
jgi:hypothetical protein